MNKINRKIQNIILAAMFLLGLALFITGSFVDESLTNKVATDSNILAIILTALGVAPSLLVGIFAGTLLLFLPKVNNKKIDVILRVFGGAFILVITYFYYTSANDYLDYPMMQSHKTLFTVILVIFIALTVGLTIFFTWKNKDKLDQKWVLPVALTIIIILIGYAGSVEVIKYVVSRPRPRNVMSGISPFKNWYEFNFLGAFKEEFKDYKSFVSGHAANTCCLITLLPLMLSLTKLKENKNALLLGAIVGLLFNVVVSISRIIAGAHYLTDVSGAIMISTLVQALVFNLSIFISNKFIKD